MPAEKPIVSALIVSFNVKPLLLKCLEAFYGHADVPVEAVVVDNASTDGSAAAVASEFPKAVVLAQQRNLGFGRANNVGLERCQGRFVLLLNPDVTVNPQALGRMADFLSTRPDAAVVGPRLLFPDGRLDPEARRSFPVPSTLFYRTVGLSRLFPRSRVFGRHNMGHLSETEVHEIDAGSAACMMVRMAALDRVGFFDPRYFMFGEDLDLCNKRKSVIVVVGFLALWLLAGFVIGEIGTASTEGAIVGTIVLGLLGIGAALYAYYLGASTVLSAMGAHEADPRQYQQLYNIVQTLAIGDGLPMPKVYVIDDPSPNAFATGRDPQHAAVTATTGLLQMMNREELEGGLSHEMSHIKNYDVRLLLVVTTMIGLAAIISSIFWRGALRMNFRGRNSGQAMLVIFAIGIIFTLIAFLVGPLMQLALSRDRESLADVSGVELTRNPVGLINALKKIAANDKPPEKFNHAVAAMCIDNPEEHHGSFFSRLFETHPPIEERIATLEKIASVQQT